MATEGAADLRPEDPREGIGAEALYAHLRRFFERCARKLRRADDMQGAERLAKASTHWLRHTHASHAIASGMPLEIAQQNLGHASLNTTTTVYVTTEGSSAPSLSKARQASKMDVILSILDISSSRKDIMSPLLDTTVYAFWNNKGGTGKTSLIFQAACRYAQNYPDRKILMIDLCPQANLSEVALGGLVYDGGGKLLKQQGLTPRCSIAGYFELCMGPAAQKVAFNATDYITVPYRHNPAMPRNVHLVCGDPLLELQALIMNSLANVPNPLKDSWLEIVDWLRDFLINVGDTYDTIFIDTNPSFSIYTQLALAASDRVVLPVMADDSSRRAITNAFSLMYGIKLPSKVYANWTFANKLAQAGRKPPKVHLIVKNRLTQYMGAASGFAAVLSGIDHDLEAMTGSYPDLFTFDEPADGIIDMRDFGQTGVVAFARGCPFSVMPTGKLAINGRRVPVTPEYRDLAIEAVDALVAKL